jgi:PilZ domain
MDFVTRYLPRNVCSFDTVAKTDADEELPVTVFNFSSGGFMLACREPLPVGARLSISLHGIGEAEARIVWAQDVQAGGKFTTPIDADRLLATIEELRGET